MRRIFLIMLGLLLFNTVFALYNPIFNSGYGDDAKGIDSSEVAGYNLKKPEDILTNAFTGSNYLIGITSLGFLGLAGVAASIFTKNYVWIGAGIFIGIVTSLYISFMDLISQLGSIPTDNNVYVTGLITIVGISIGVLAIFNLVDMFAPHPT